MALVCECVSWFESGEAEDPKEKQQQVQQQERYIKQKQKNKRWKERESMLLWFCLLS